MEINKATLFEAIDKMERTALLQLLQDAFENMNERTQRAVFGEIYKVHTKSERTPDDLLADIEAFYSRSLLGHYYAPFRINSKNFMDVPEETEEWFDKLGYYLDFTSELVAEKQYEAGIQCFKLLFELIDKMGDGEEIVFADELGDWMITTKTDYVEHYIIAVTHAAETTTEYVAALIPRLQEDSYFSFYNKVYKKIKKHASKEQLQAINTAIEEHSIRVR